MNMNKKVVISIVCLIIAVALFAIIWNVVGNKDDGEEIINDINNDLDVEDENYMEISEPEVDNSVVESSNSDLSEDNQRYLLKSVDNYIYVYYLTDDNEEILYRETDISVDYLSQQDMDDLEVGIEVTGIEQLNKLIEDFE